MTGKEWRREAARELEKAGNEDAAFEVRCLWEDFSGQTAANEGEPLTPTAWEHLTAALQERLCGRPLQYILGKWDFLSLTLAVGEGVLIPRPDTECLCETAAAALQGREHPHLLDLCAGSGCVGLGTASLLPPGTRVTAVELSEEALPYLRRNSAAYPAYAMTVRKGDVREGPRSDEPLYDAILSNPPYIPTRDIPGLSQEVRREPVMALDGAADGLMFYRVIAEKWLSCLRPGGLAAVEVGIGEAAAVAALWRAVGLTEVTVTRDLVGVERVVSGFRPQKAEHLF